MGKNGKNGKKANGQAKGNGKHRRNTKGLRPPWKPGESGNPKGRPPGLRGMKKCIEDELGEYLEKSGISVEQAVAKRLVRGAVAGNHQFMKMLMDRLLPATNFHQVEGEITPADILGQLRLRNQASFETFDEDFDDL